MIHETRIQALNDSEKAGGDYVLYWMQASQRAGCNHALEYAILQGNERNLPVLVCFGLMDGYPEANERHYAFMLEGLSDAAESLRRRGIKTICRHGSPPQVALHFGKRAVMIIADRGYTNIQRRWRDELADAAKCAVVQVESDLVVPVEVASDHHEFAARTIRPKIHRNLPTYLVPLDETPVKLKSTLLDVAGDIDLTDVAASLAKLKIDRTVKKSTRFVGGQSAGRKVLANFLAKKLDGYGARRNEPADQGTSTMAAYLHFGQLSPLEIALAVRDSKSAPQSDRDSYLEELIVRRELSVNFCHFEPKYDSYDSLPNWAKKTLAERRNDPRPHLYTREQLEQAKSYDPYWNAAQLEMTKTGFMHNYMRMYWGKKILEWSPTPQEAFDITLYLNNKYFLCGRDPNGYANVAWIFGLHDRPWGPARPIFGTVRYMNAAGLERKFDMDAYVAWVAGL